MKTGRSVLREKLTQMGYNDVTINSIVGKLNLDIIDERMSQFTDEEIEGNIFTIEEYDSPNVEIIRTFLNIGEEILQCEILEGDITPSSTESAVKTRIPTADYTLSKRCAVVAITEAGKIKIVLYKPSQKSMNMYNNMTYEQVYKSERDEITKEYYEAFLNSRKIVLNDRKVRDILTMLLSDFVIDEMAVNDLNPLIRNYDAESKYAEGLNSYSLRYINTKTNRLEIFEREASVKIKSKSVKVGKITNDPYVKMHDLPSGVDFPLNSVSYYWLEKTRGIQGEIAIFVATRPSEKAMYSDLFIDDNQIDNVAKEIIRRARMESSQELDIGVIRDILTKLNRELVCPSTDVIYNNLPVKSDTFEPLKYRYRIITDPAEFEERLYITIEDNVARRYKYKLVENIFDDATTIGNKLEYTDAKGNVVHKQSIADFNINAMSVVIRRETIIDESCIPDLLGYIYEDMPYYGTDSLPVPQIEVDIYLPSRNADKNNVTMYNGTSESTANGNFFSGDSVGSNEVDEAGFIISGGVKLPGSTRLIVRYVNSKGEILKENKIGNVFPNSTYLPDVIPVINDKQGREWVVENERSTTFVISSNPDLNVIEIKYIEKYSRVHISTINRDGKKLADDRAEIVQVGTSFDFTQKKHFVDAHGDEWKLVSARPGRLVISEDENKNKVILMYDIDRADVTIRYKTRQGKEIAPPVVIQNAVDKVYRADSVPYIVDEDGLGWLYVETSENTILVKSEEPNEITLLYDEAKQKVVTRVIDEKGNELVDQEVNFVQIGQKCSVSFEKLLYDYECKEWLYKNAIADEIIVDSDASKNILEAVYVPHLTKASLKFEKLDGRTIKESVVEDAQIGAVYNYSSKNEIIDNFGKVWKLADAGKTIVISENVRDNVVTLKYEPWMSKVTVNYLNTESKELIPSKMEIVQAGSQYKNVPIKKFTDADGKRWILDESKIPTLTVGKHDEENIVSIYYDKETTKITVSFSDAFGNQLLDDKEVDGQIGAIYDPSLFNRITDTNGGRWSIEKTEPKNLMVKERDNKFKFIYEEVKAKVLVKHINVRTEKTIVEDILTTVNLGGIYVPNIRQKVIDKNKWEWKYIGEDNINIVAQENEQENIIVLTYEESRAPITAKFQNKEGQKLKEDAVREVQIGKEVRAESTPKFNDINGLGWKFVKYDIDFPIVRAEGNIITNTYEPLMAPIVRKFIDAENNTLIPDKEEKLQVGKKYTLQPDNIIVDSEDASWLYKEASATEIVAKDEVNVIECRYDKLLADVTLKYVDEKGELISPEVITKYQVGTFVITDVKQNFVDAEGKAWVYTNINEAKLKVTDDPEKNIIVVSYRKDMTDVPLEFYNMEMVVIAPGQTVKAQIGSMFKPAVRKQIIDDKMLGWDLREDLLKPIKVSREIKENLMKISYDKYLVDVTTYYKDASGKDVIKPKVEKHQVGTTVMPEISEFIEDELGREWISANKVDNKFFGGNKKVDPLTVSTAFDTNFIKLSYDPHMIKVVVRYVDPMGNEVRPSNEYEAQIGSIYQPEIIEKVVGAGNKKWTYNVNSKAEIKISKNVKENVVSLAYEEEKAFVIYIYKDEDNNKVKESRKIMAQIGSAHKVNAENVVESSDGRVWEFKAASRDELLVNDEDKNNMVELVYMPLKVEAVVQFVTLNGNMIIEDKIVTAQLGSVFKPDIDQRISDDESKQYKFVKCEPENLKIKETPVGSEKIVNVFKLTYESLVAPVITKFTDIDGNELKDAEEKIFPVGTIYQPEAIRFITDKNGIQWEIVETKFDPITVMEDTRQNEVTMVYEVAKAEISIRYKDIEGNTIKATDLLELEVGSEFIPEVERELTDSENKKWVYSRTEPIKLTVGSINNIINIIYQEKKALVTIKVQATEGKQLKDDVKVKAQIGAKFAPPPVIKVIYDNNGEIWRYAYNNPSDIIVDENEVENVVIQYFTAQNFATKDEGNKPYFNPDAEKFIDKDLAEQVAKEEEEKKRLEEEEQKKKDAEEAARKASEYHFEDKYLKELERNMQLTNEERITINQLNDYNTEIVTYLREALVYSGTLEEYDLVNKLGTVIRKEKQLVEEGLAKIIADDKTGNKILKIFEAITNSETGDKDFYYLEQKKAILFADYFINKNVSTIEEANYIIMRGKNTKGIELVNQGLQSSGAQDKELVKLKVILIYECVMLDNYYRARSLAKDKYFVDENSKMQMGNEIVVMVTNTLPKQAARLIAKWNSLTQIQANELESILELLTPQQMTTVMNTINAIPDGKERKAQLKFFKDITGMK